jgi:hypothetical protein
MRKGRAAIAATLLVTALAAVPATGPAAQAVPSGVQFGAVVATRGGETFAQAIARQDAAYGVPDPMPISRVFYSGAPQAWPGNHGMSGRPVVVSFRYAPTQVTQGRYDAALRSWFANAPDYDVYWSYSHEPEDNIARGEFTAAQYRAAWQHISDIADEEAPESAQLHSTLIVMCYTMNPASGRNWRDYYVPDAQSMLAFDCYNHAGKRNQYGNPANIFKPLINWANANPTIPWGVSEVGSVLANNDADGTRRAAWLRDVANFLVAKYNANPAIAAQFVLYYDVVGPKGTDYRLSDNNSKLAWRDIVQNF